MCTTTQKPSPSFHCWWTILFYFYFSHTFIFYAPFQYHSFGSQGGGRRFDSANGYCFFWALVINLLGFWNLLDKKEHTRFMWSTCREPSHLKIILYTSLRNIEASLNNKVSLSKWYLINHDQVWMSSAGTSKYLVMSDICCGFMANYSFLSAGLLWLT